MALHAPIDKSRKWWLLGSKRRMHSYIYHIEWKSHCPAHRASRTMCEEKLCEVIMTSFTRSSSSSMVKVKGSNLDWNSEIFSVVPSLVSKQPSFTALLYFPANHKFVSNNFISDITKFLLWSIPLIPPRLSWVLSWFSLGKKMKSHSVSINALDSLIFKHWSPFSIVQKCSQCEIYL